MFDDILGTRPAIQQSSGIKINDSENSTDIAIAAPGINKEDFDISIRENTLTVSYEQSTTDNPRAFSQSAFTRSWSLPKGTKTKDITAQYDAGILTVSIRKPKKVEPKTHTIKIA